METRAFIESAEAATETKLVLWSTKENVRLEAYGRASLVVQWLRIRLPTQDTQVRIPVQEDHICQGAAKPACQNYLTLDQF